VLEAMPHGFIPGTPEDRHLVREMLRFIDAHATPAASRHR
jgi:hypothetical protein